MSCSALTRSVGLLLARILIFMPMPTLHIYAQAHAHCSMQSHSTRTHAQVFLGVWLRRQGQSLLLGNYGQNDQQVTGHQKNFQRTGWQVLLLHILLIRNIRITGGKVVIDGETHQLSLNDFGTKFRHHVHGGKNSFDR